VSLTLPRLWAFLSLACIFVILNLVFVHPHDFWWHVRAGQWIVDNGRVPAVDLFSYTQAGEPWAYQSWLMEIILYLLVRVGDLPLVILFNTMVITTAYGVLLLVNRQAAAGDLRWAALATLAGASLALLNKTPRPQTISFLLLVLTLYLVERDAWQRDDLDPQVGGKRSLWWLVPLFALWANAHGGFVLGLALLGTYLLARLLAWLRKQGPFPVTLLLVTVFSATATLITPLGLGMIDYVLGFLRHPVTRSLNAEFWPPTVRTLDGLLFFGFALALVVLLFVSRYRPTAREALRLLLFGGLALMARRNATWFGFVAAPTLAACLHCWAVGRGVAVGMRAGRPRLNRALAVVAGLLILLSLPWIRPYLSLPEQNRGYISAGTPVEAVTFLGTLVESSAQPGRVFHTETCGSYMIWASPEVPVFIDTRVELYPEKQWRDYLALGGGRQDWEAILGNYGVDTLLLERGRQGPLIEAATASPDWKERYRDDQAVILQHQEMP
jgi:hypothetical protein